MDADTAAARALAAGDPLGALKRIALRDDAPALALRGIAMARLGELDPAPFPPATRAAHELLVAGIVIRRLRPPPRSALPVNSSPASR